MKKLLSVLITLSALSCVTVNKVSLTNINDLASIKPGDKYYSLPQSRLQIEVTAVRHITIPGPYNAYAEKYLGFSPALSINKTEWELLDMELKSVPEPDPEFGFILQTNNLDEIQPKLTELSNSGYIIDISDYISYSQFYPYLTDKPEALSFPDMGIKPMIEKDIRTSTAKNEDGDNEKEYRTQRHSDDSKSLELRASEAADFIIKLRKRRFKMLVGQEQPVPGGEGVENSVKALNEIEKEYISLFMGKTYSDTLHKTFYYTPKPSLEMERHIICRFSEETGFIDETATLGTPLVLELKKMKMIESLKNLQIYPSGPEFQNVILYRIPEKASAQIFFGSSIILDAEIRIFQYGSLVSLETY